MYPTKTNIATMQRYKNDRLGAKKALRFTEIQKDENMLFPKKKTLNYKKTCRK